MAKKKKTNALKILGYSLLGLVGFIIVMMIIIGGSGVQPATPVRDSTTSTPPSIQKDLAQFDKELERCTARKQITQPSPFLDWDYYRNSCLRDLAIDNNIPELCDKMYIYDKTDPSAVLNDGCLTHFVETLGDVSFCDRIKNEYYKNLCFEEYTPEKFEELERIREEKEFSVTEGDGTNMPDFIANHDLSNRFGEDYRIIYWATDFEIVRVGSGE